MDAHKEEVHNLFQKTGKNCSVMMRDLEPIIGPTLPSLRTLQVCCRDFRLEGRRAERKQTTLVRVDIPRPQHIEFEAPEPGATGIDGHR